MKITNKILTAILICMPLVAWGVDTSSLTSATDKDTLYKNAVTALDNLENDETNYGKIPKATRKDIIDKAKSNLEFDSSDSGSNNNSDENKSDSDEKDSDSDESKTKEDDLQKKVDEAQEKLDEAKETEHSTANRMLGGLSTLATGIGGMQLAQGLAEKNADSDADKDMDAYMATIKCTYGDGKSVPFSVDPVELPGGNNSDLMKYRAEYVALAKDLKERKTALDMTPGIEAEEIIDKATAGLYDDENTGVTGGAYASRYRAAAGNEKDQKGLSSDKSEAKKRMIAGGVLVGVGVVGGIIGNSIINGKLGDLIKESRADKQKSKDHDETVKTIKRALKDKGYTNVDDLDFDNVDVGALKDADWSKLEKASSGNRDAKSLISTANKTSLISSLKDLGVKGSEDD